MRRTIPLLITALTGAVLIFSHFIPAAESWENNFVIWFDLIAGIAFILGGGNLVTVHLKKISDQQRGWGFSVVTLVAFFVTLTVGLTKWGTLPNPDYPAFPWSGDYMQERGPFWWIFNHIFRPLQATMFSLLAFFVASAAFRAFRAKNMEAILLLCTAFIILLARTYAGTVMTAWLPESLAFLKLENLTTFIMSVFTTAGNRAIMIGVGLGIVATSLKILLGIDRSYLGSGED